MTEYHSTGQLLDSYPRRCQQFGVCPKITGRILSVCVEAELQALTEEETVALNNTNAQIVGKLCPDGQTKHESRLGRSRLICGMLKEFEVDGD